MRPTINSEKHYVQHPLTALASGVTTALTLAQTTSAAPTTAFHVRVGAVVKAVFLEYWIKDDASTQGNVLLSFVKTTDGQVPNHTDMIALNAYQNKKNVLYHTQGLTNNDTANAQAFVRDWFKVPKGKQRLGLGDTLWLVISAQTSGQVFCGFATYKEFY